MKSREQQLIEECESAIQLIGAQSQNGKMQINYILNEIASWKSEASRDDKNDELFGLHIDQLRVKFVVEILKYIRTAIQNQDQNYFPQLQAALFLLKKIVKADPQLNLSKYAIEFKMDKLLAKILKKFNESELGQTLDLSEITKRTENEKKLAFKIADMGQKWQIENIDIFGKKNITEGTENKLVDRKQTWRNIRGNIAVSIGWRVPDMVNDAIYRLGLKNNNDEFQPVGNCFDQCRANFLFVVTQNLEDTSMIGKTVLQVKYPHGDHVFLIMTDLSISELYQLQLQTHPMSDQLYTIDLNEIKKADPGAYIIDSWRMGVFNEPKPSLHCAPLQSNNTPTEQLNDRKLTECQVQCMGVAGRPDLAVRYYKWDYNGQQLGWETGYIPTQALANDPGWQNFTKEIHARKTPEAILQVMQQQSVVTYKQHK